MPLETLQQVRNFFIVNLLSFLEHCPPMKEEVKKTLLPISSLFSVQKAELNQSEERDGWRVYLKVWKTFALPVAIKNLETNTIFIV